MSQGVNQVVLLGHVGKDPEIRFTQSNNAICNFSLAISERKKEGDKWVDHTEWMRVVCFGKTAENVAQYVKKGRQLYVTGKIRTSEYADKKTGEIKYSTQIVADQIIFLGGNDGASRTKPRTPTASTPTASTPTASTPPAIEHDEDDLPF